MKIFLLGVDQQTLQILHAQGDLCLIMRLHDRNRDNGISITHQLPGIDLIEYHTVLDRNGAAGILFVLQVNNRDAAVTQFLIAALCNGQLRVGTGSRRLRNDGDPSNRLHRLIDGKADFPASHAAREPFRGASHQVRLDDDLAARLYNIFQATHIRNDLVHGSLDVLIALIRNFSNGYYRHILTSHYRIQSLPTIACPTMVSSFTEAFFSAWIITTPEALTPFARANLM